MSKGDKGDALQRLGADIKHCARCGAYFRVCEHQHRVWGKAVVPSGMLIASVTTEEARITMSFNNPDTGIVTAYFYTLYCSNHCAWWHSQYFRALPEVTESKVGYWRAVPLRVRERQHRPIYDTVTI